MRCFFHTILKSRTARLMLIAAGFVLVIPWTSFAFDEDICAQDLKTFKAVLQDLFRGNRNIVKAMEEELTKVKKSASKYQVLENEISDIVSDQKVTPDEQKMIIKMVKKSKVVNTSYKKINNMIDQYNEELQRVREIQLRAQKSCR